MRKLLLTLMVSSLAFVNAQNLVPDFKNQPMLVKADKLLKLEKQSPEIKMAIHGMGYGGATTNLNLTEKSSPVRTTLSPEFIIKVDADVDPESLFYLAKCLKPRGGRSVELSKTSAFAAYGAKGKSAKRFHIALTFTKVSDGIYKITTDKLEEGEEYAFVSVAQGTSSGNSTIFAFGAGQPERK